VRLIFFILIGLLVLHPSALAEDLVTTSGTVYHNFTIIKIEDGMLTINYEEGTATIKIEALPEDFRQRYGLILVPVSHKRPPTYLDKLVLKNGITYSGVTIVKVQPDGLTVLHHDGGAQISFENLSEEICSLYNITAEKAKIYRMALKAEQEKIADNKAAIPSKIENTEISSENIPTNYSSENTVYVHGYYRKDGTYVNGYTRRKR